MRSALSAKVRDERLTRDRGSRRDRAEDQGDEGVIAALPESRSILIVIPDKVESVDRAAGNLRERLH